MKNPIALPVRINRYLLFLQMVFLVDENLWAFFKLYRRGKTPERLIDIMGDTLKSQIDCMVHTAKFAARELRK